MDSIIRIFGFSLVLADFQGREFISISNASKVSDIKSLLSKLRPIQNGHDLVRIGDHTDGGYLIPDDLDSVVACFSAGCDKIWTFEESLFSNYGIRSHILDSEDKRPFELASHHTFTPKWLGHKDSSTHIRFQTWLELFGHQESNELILQMDIEGFEWEFLSTIPVEILTQFRIIIIEFHYISRVRSRQMMEDIFIPSLEKVLSVFDVVHFHSNNCCGTVNFGDFEFPNVFEVTFHKKNRSLKLGSYTRIPHEFDRRNISNIPDIAVPWS